MPSEWEIGKLYVNGRTICIEFFFCLFEILVSAGCAAVTKGEILGAWGINPLAKVWRIKKTAKIVSIQGCIACQPCNHIKETILKSKTVWKGIYPFGKCHSNGACQRGGLIKIVQKGACLAQKSLDAPGRCPRMHRSRLCHREVYLLLKYDSKRNKPCCSGRWNLLSQWSTATALLRPPNSAIFSVRCFSADPVAGAGIGGRLCF